MSTSPTSDPTVERPKIVTAIDLLCIAITFALIGLWYAGPVFIAHFADAIPAGAVGKGLGHMIPGDQFEAYYRHTLPYYNLNRDRWPFYSAYEYALNNASRFTDSMIVLPSAILVSLMASLIGPIAAFNSMAILSFSLCGMFGYLLGRELTGSRLAGLVAASVIALLPFRVGFLFGEMIYATDMAFLPLSIFLFIKLLRTNKTKYAAAFSLSILLLATANFALLYWFTLLLFPYFLAGALYIVVENWSHWRKLCSLTFAAAIPLAVAAVYLLHVKGVLTASGLASGQKIDVVRFYSPTVHDFITRWNGIEKTIYTGFSCLLALFGLVSLKTLRKHNADTILLFTSAYFAVLFFVSYILAFGVTFDDATGVHLYTAMFHHIPFANNSRTPGRLMPIVGVCTAILAAICMRQFLSIIRYSYARVLIVMIIVAIIAADFKFSDATMSVLESNNRAYAAINSAKGSALGIPFESQADNYLGTTYQYFALVNDIRMVNGHSSTFPPDWLAFYEDNKSLNYGAATRSILENLLKRGVYYLVVQHTVYEPHVSTAVLTVFDSNPALRRMQEDSGVILYAIVDPELAPKSFDESAFAEALKIGVRPGSRSNSAQAQSNVEELSGWYGRESYPGQIPFRWMAGTSSLLFVTPGIDDHVKGLAFSFKCPSGEVKVSGAGIGSVIDPVDANGWHKVVVHFPSNDTSVVTLTAPSIYSVPTDARKFGCMISDFTF